MIKKLNDYYTLAKPGMVYGNLLTAVAGYLFASRLSLNWAVFLAMCAGTTLIMGSACSLNNLFDRDIDVIMERTSKRPSANRTIPFLSGIIFAIILGVLGIALLALFVNWLCVAIGLIGFIDYALIYTYFKRKTYHSTLIGSIAGAMPIVGGYVAYAGHLDGASLIVGLMMLLWQMPHFYAIALFRESDYRKAKIPLLPIVKGYAATTNAMAVYNLLFSVAVISLYFYSKLSVIYVIVLGIASLAWLIYNFKGRKLNFLKTWARKSFVYSLLVVVLMSVMLALR